MPNIPSGTKFMGVNPDVDTAEKRSSLSNSYQEYYTIDDIVADAIANDTNIYNTDGTLDGNRVVDLDGNTVEFDNGNVGVNVTPSVPFHVRGIAVPSSNENIARIDVSDATGAYLDFRNGSLVDGEFVAEIVARQSSLTNQNAIIQGGYIDSTQDSGSTPVTIFRSALATLAPVVTRPLFAFRNWSTTVLTILANGNIQRLSTSVIIPNVQSVTSAATVTPVLGNDLVKVTAQAAAIAFANPTGTWVEGKDLMIRLKDNGTARAITFDTKYRAIGVTLPTTTTINKTTYIGIIYNATDDKFDVIGVTTEA